MRCEICGKPGQRHHLITRGAGGSDDPVNIIYLCIEHHVGPQGIHTLGRNTFANRHGLEGRLKKAREARWKQSASWPVYPTSGERYG